MADGARKLITVANETVGNTTVNVTVNADLCTGSGTSPVGPNGSSISQLFTAQVLDVPNGASSVSTTVTALHGSTQTYSVQALILVGIPGVSSVDMGVAGDTTRFVTGGSPSANTEYDSFRAGVAPFFQSADDEVKFSFNAPCTADGGQIHCVCWRQVSIPPTS